MRNLSETLMKTLRWHTGRRARIVCTLSAPGVDPSAQKWKQSCLFIESRIPYQSQKWHKRGIVFRFSDVNDTCIIEKKEPVKRVQMYLLSKTPWQQARVNVAALQRCPSWENHHEKVMFSVWKWGNGVFRAMLLVQCLPVYHKHLLNMNALQQWNAKQRFLFFSPAPETCCGAHIQAVIQACRGLGSIWLSRQL